MVSASSRIVQSTPVPTLMWLSIGCVCAAYTSCGSAITCTLAAAMSSTCRNSRIGVPLPQITTSGASACTASWKRRSSAGMTCEFSGWKLSPGPYRLVGITLR